MMNLNFRWVNTGLDERIVKSITSTPNKTEKLVLVHDSKRGNYYRNQLVNVEHLQNEFERLLQQQQQQKESQQTIDSHRDDHKPSHRDDHKPSHRDDHNHPTNSSETSKQSAQQLFQQSEQLGIAAKDLKAAQFVHRCLTLPTERTKAVNDSRIARHQLVDGSPGTKCSLSDVPKSVFLKISKFIKDSYKPHFTNDNFSKNYKINGIYKITDLADETEFEKLKQQNTAYQNQTVLGKNCQTDTFIHGTTYPALLSLLGKTGKFLPTASTGGGTNVTVDSNYSLDYAIGRYDDNDPNGVLLLCEGSIGEHTTKPQDRSDATLAVNTGMINYFVFKKDHSLIPRYVIDVTSRQPS